MMDDHPTDADEPTPSQQVATAHAAHIKGDERRQWARVLMLGAALVFVVATVAGLGLQNRNLAQQNVALSESRLATAADIKELVTKQNKLLDLGNAVSGPDAVTAQAETLARVLAIADCDNRAVTQDLVDRFENAGLIPRGSKVTCPTPPPGVGSTTTTTGPR